MSVKFSVIITTYNRKNLISRSIDSAVKACNKEDEIIVIDDGSSDGTKKYLKEKYNNKIRYYYKKNGGLSTARNLGINRANNPYIAFLDDDDEWFPFKLNLQRKIFEKYKDILFCFSNFSATKKTGERIENYLFNWGQPLKDWRKILQEKKNIDTAEFEDIEAESVDIYQGNLYLSQLLDDYILPSTLAYNRNLLKKDLLFLDGFERHQSWLFSSGLARQGKSCYIDMDTTIQHGHDGYRLTNVTEVFESKAKLFVIENEWGKNADFLHNHENVYLQRLEREIFKLVRVCVAAKEFSEAKAILRGYGYLSSRLKALNLLPGWSYALALFLKRMVKLRGRA